MVSKCLHQNVYICDKEYFLCFEFFEHLKILCIKVNKIKINKAKTIKKMGS